MPRTNAKTAAKLARERRQLCQEAEALKERCFRAGLYLTAQKMDRVTQQIGWEVAALESGVKPNEQG